MPERKDAMPVQHLFMRQRGWVAFTAWFGCLIVLLAVCWRPKTAPIDVDEVYWIGSAYYYNLAFKQRDWSHPDWRLLPARENPPVAKYVIGMSLALTGRRIAAPGLLGCFYAIHEAIPGGWGVGPEHEKRAQVVARMDPEIHRRIQEGGQVSFDPGTLVTSRCAMLGCVIIASFLVLIFGRLIGSWLAGLAASQLLLVHPAVIFAYNHATADAVALVFSTAAALFGLWFVRACSLPRPMGLGGAAMLALAGGVLLALACGAKMNSLIVLFSTTAAILTTAGGMLWRRDYRRAAKCLALAGVMLATGSAVFVLLNPTILNDLIGGLKACVVEHRLTEQVQAGFVRGHLTTLAEKFNVVSSLAFFGRLGCGAVAALAIWWASKGEGLALKFTAAWWIIGFVCVTLWIPFAWLRYVLPLVVPSVLLIGWSLHAAFTRAVLGTRGRGASQ